jgi:tetratricopeptide (TPR) repeat protein
LLTGLILLSLGGCASRPPAEWALPGVELAEVPFYPQEIHECGPAALATVLEASGEATTPEALVPEVYVPGREGSLQVELIASARRHGRVPYALKGHPKALTAALQAGDPVLVLQNLRLRSWPQWHYAVVVGYEPVDDRWLLRSGREKRQRLSSAVFLNSWDIAGRWAVVMADPAQPPPYAELDSWLQASAPFEALGRLDLAQAAYAAAAERWPGRALPHLALANLAYARGDHAAAERELRRAQALEPSPVVSNNLAQVLLERGCVRAARAVLDDPALAGLNDPAVAKAIDDTRSAVQAYSGGDAAACSPAP